MQKKMSYLGLWHLSKWVKTLSKTKCLSIFPKFKYLNKKNKNFVKFKKQMWESIVEFRTLCQTFLLFFFCKAQVAGQQIWTPSTLCFSTACLLHYTKLKIGSQLDEK